MLYVKRGYMENILSLIKPILATHQIELYELVWRQEQRQKILSVAIMYPDGSMDLDTCADISELISTELDKADFIAHDYYLEVCSPGAERVLRDLNEVSQAVGSYVALKLNSPINQNYHLEGTLLAINGDLITLEVKEATKVSQVELYYHQIKKIRLAIKF